MGSKEGEEHLVYVRMNLLNVFRNDLNRRKIVNTLENLVDLEIFKILRATAMNKVILRSFPIIRN